MADKLIPEAALRWMLGRFTGRSSESIWANMVGVKPYDGWNHPHDPADLSRCFRLLREVPQWAVRLPEMARRSKEWARLVAAWPALEASMEAEVGWDWSKGQRAPLTYSLMKSVLAAKETA
jgi:hypothetical protein